MTNGKIKISPVYLPDDLLLNCLARVSRLHYPTLSLVSKRFRSLVTSLELYETRALIGRTESCLHVCLRFSSGPRWFTLCQSQRPTGNSRWLAPCFRPDGSVEEKTSGNISHPDWSTRAVIGSNIYTFGECIGFSSRVFFMDCRSHTWHEAPSMQIPRNRPLVSVLDGKIYVAEGCNSPGSSNLIEIFDPETQIWKHVPSPRAEILGRRRCTLKSVAMDGKLYLFGDKKCMVYMPEENKCDVVELSDMPLGLVRSVFSCVIDNVIYCSGTSEMLQWYDSEGRLWRDLKGSGELPKLPKRGRGRVRLADYGGKIALLWEKKVRAIGSEEKMIWCAVFSVEKRCGREIYGKIEWCDVVLTVPKSCRVLDFLAVAV